MKRFYSLLAVFAIVLSSVAQGDVLLVDEDITDWQDSGTPTFTMDEWQVWKDNAAANNEARMELGNWYINWPDYTTPGGLAVKVEGGRFREGSSATIDILVDDFVVGDGTAGTPGEKLPGAIIFTVPSISEIEVTSRSGSNTAVDPADRHLYIAEWDIFDEDWKQVSHDFPLSWGGTGEADSYKWDTPYDEEVQIAIRCKRMPEGGENLRVHGFKVWGSKATSINHASKANVMIYSVPGSDKIRIGGDVVNVKVYNLAGTLVFASMQIGFQDFSTSELSKGVYLVNVTDSNGLKKTEKVVVR